MDKETFIKIINERKKFRSDLKKKLQKKSFSFCEGDCYLIEESWDKNLNEKIVEYAHEENEDYEEFIPPKFINNIESIINYIKTNKNLKLISKKSIVLIYGKKSLKNNNLIKYYSGNNKLIIEYLNDEDYKSILLIDPLNKNNIKERSFIISTEDIDDEEEIKLYKNIINKDIDIDIIKDNIIPIKTYLKFNELINKLKKKIKFLEDKKGPKYERNLINKLVNEKNSLIKQIIELKKNIKEKDKEINQKVNLTNQINELNKNIKEKYKEINKLSEELQKQIKYKNQYLSINKKQTEYRENLEKNLNNEINKYKEILKEKDKEIKEYKLKIEQNLINKNKENNEMISNSQKLSKSVQNIFNQSKNIPNEQDLIKLKKELKKREDMIIEKEKELNNKITFLEDKENLIEKENNENKKRKEEFQKDLQENERLKKENIDLIKRNKELEEEIKKKESKLKSTRSKNKMEEYIVPTLIGLNNIGATCFMNSTLQCLSQTCHLTKYFLNEKNENRILNNNLALKKQNLQLSPIYLELIKSLWNKNGPKSFSPNKFMNIIEKMNPLFKQGQAGDSKDFIIFILEQLHRELKSPIKLNNNNMNVPLNQYNKNNAFNYFFNDFKKECSIISDVFFGFTETTNECLYCKNNYNSKGYATPICYNYGIFNCLIFPLEEVKNLKNNDMQNNNNFKNNNNIVSIYDCFYYNQKDELFTGDNRNYCNICKQLYDSIYSSKIFVSPNVLILILNRGKDNKFNVKLTFDETIDISSFVLQKDKPKIIYNLYGVITHIGQSGPNAHFVASCKSPIDHKWYRYNDSMVNSIENIQKEVIDFGTPYILFYQKNK